MKRISLTIHGLVSEKLLANIQATHDAMKNDPRSKNWSPEVVDGMFNLALLVAITDVSADFGRGCAAGMALGMLPPLKQGEDYSIGTAANGAPGDLYANLRLTDVPS